MTVFVDNGTVIEMDEQDFREIYSPRMPWYVDVEGGQRPAVVRSACNGVPGDKVRLAYIILGIEANSRTPIEFINGDPFDYRRDNLQVKTDFSRASADVRAEKKAARHQEWVRTATARVQELRRQQDHAVLPQVLSDELYRTEDALEKFGIIA